MWLYYEPKHSNIKQLKTMSFTTILNSNITSNVNTMVNIIIKIDGYTVIRA